MNLSSTQVQFLRHQLHERRSLMTFGSGSRTSGTNSSPVFEIKRGFNAKGPLSVVSVVVPVSYYAVNASNNTVDFTENGVDLTATVPPGNYNTTTIRTALLAEMNAVSAGVFTMDYDPATFHLSWTNDTHTFVIDPDSTMGQILGVTATQTLALTQESNDAVELSGPRSIFVESRALGRGRERHLVNGLQSRPVLVNIPVSVPAGDILTWEDASPGHHTFLTGTSQVNEIDFRLADLDGNEIDLNGLEWEITVSVVLTA